MTGNRTVATAALVESIVVRVGLVSAYVVIWHTSYIFKLFFPELWRIPTSFLLTGDGFSMIMEPYFLYRYISELEVGNARFPRKEDVVYYLMFVSVALIVSLSHELCQGVPSTRDTYVLSHYVLLCLSMFAQALK